MKQTLLAFDHRLTARLQGRPAWASWIMHVVTFGASPIVIVPVLVVGIWVSMHAGQPNVSRAFSWGLAAVIVDTLLKPALRRQRPDTLYARKMWPRTHSFPSGHSFGAAVVYGLAAFWGLNHMPAPWNVVAVVALLAGILAIGYSRVYLGAHYAFDVLAGWVLGGVATILIITLVD